MYDWLYYVLLLVLLFLGLFLNILSLPGLWVMIFSAAVYMWATDRSYFGWITLGVLTALAIAAEVVEFLAGSAGAKRAGGSGRAGWGALIGALVGGFTLTLPFPIIGTIFGVCAGAFLGASLAESTARFHGGHLVRVGWGAAKARFHAILWKLGFGILIFIIAAYQAFPYPHRSNAAPQ